MAFPDDFEHGDEIGSYVAAPFKSVMGLATGAMFEESEEVATCPATCDVINGDSSEIEVEGFVLANGSRGFRFTVLRDSSGPPLILENFRTL